MPVRLYYRPCDLLLAFKSSQDGQSKLTCGSAKRRRRCPEMVLDALQAHEEAVSIVPFKMDEDGKAVGTDVPYTTLFKLRKRKGKLIQECLHSVLLWRLLICVMRGKASLDVLSPKVWSHGGDRSSVSVSGVLGSMTDFNASEANECIR